MGTAVVGILVVLEITCLTTAMVDKMGRNVTGVDVVVQSVSVTEVLLRGAF